MLLSAEDARIWVEHVGLTSERRKAGAKKAAETRARKRQDRQAAQEDEIESDDGGDLWCYCRDIEHGFMIQCDSQGPSCFIWYHGPCVKISKKKGRQMEITNTPFICYNCH